MTAGIEDKATEELRAALILEHRKVVGEWSGNFGGHVGIRDGWVQYDDDTVIEPCDVCDLILASTTPERLARVLHEDNLAGEGYCNHDTDGLPWCVAQAARLVRRLAGSQP